MDNIILGLLLMCDRTIYQLRERIDQGINLMYSSSMGSIQAAIKKLLNCGYINYRETIDNRKYKKIYYITESGKQRFFEWINTPIEEQSPRNPELAKIYFMGFSDKENRETTIRKHLRFLEEQYNALAVICEEGKNIEIPEEHKDILNYQLASALYGRDIIKFNIDWFEIYSQRWGREKYEAASIRQFVYCILHQWKRTCGVDTFYSRRLCKP